MTAGSERVFFVTAVTWQRRCIFNADLAQTFIETIYDYRAQGKFALHAFVVMPDHMHLLLTPDDLLSVERSMQLIKGGFSHRIRQSRPNLLIWEKSFTKHRIRGSRDFESHLEYIHQNPVRRGLVAEAAEYAYSSAHPHFETDPSPVTAAEAGVI